MQFFLRSRLPFLISFHQLLIKLTWFVFTAHVSCGYIQTNSRNRPHMWHYVEDGCRSLCICRHLRFLLLLLLLPWRQSLMFVSSAGLLAAVEQSSSDRVLKKNESDRFILFRWRWNCSPIPTRAIVLSIWEKQKGPLEWQEHPIT